MALMKFCLHPGCTTLVEGGRCAEHKKQHERYRGSASSRGYGRRHQKIREVVMREEPLCRECLKIGRVTPGVEMDHIDGNPYNTARINLQMLCKPCHSVKTIRENGGFKGVGDFQSLGR